MGTWDKQHQVKIIINAINNQYGSGTLNVKANDGELDSEEISFIVNVENINDLPSFTDIANPDSTDEDSDNIVLSIIPTDEDPTDVLSVSFQSSNELLIAQSDISIDIEDAVTNTQRTITINPKDNAYGESTITVSVSDATETISKQFSVIVNSINDAPVLDSIDDITINEDIIGSMPLVASDVDYVSLSYEVIGSNEIEASITENILSFNGIENYYGSSSIIVKVFDLSFTSIKSFSLTT